VRYIIVHCSDSPWGDVEVIRSWHLARGWADIGYHYVVLNGRLKGSADYHSMADGRVDPGRPEERPGAHAAGYNNNSLGVCLIGRDVFSDKQIRVLPLFIRQLMIRFGIPIRNVIGHYEVDPRKTCPNIDMDWLRSRV